MCHRIRDRKFATLLLVATFIVIGVLLYARFTSAPIQPSAYRRRNATELDRANLPEGSDSLDCVPGLKSGGLVGAGGGGDGMGGSFYRVSDDVYIYSAFVDRRFSRTFVRLLGMQDQDAHGGFSCRFRFPSSSDGIVTGGNRKSNSVPITTSISGFAIYPDWPSLKLRHHAFQYLCDAPPKRFPPSPRDVRQPWQRDVTFSVVSFDGKYETVIPLFDAYDEDDVVSVKSDEEDKNVANLHPNSTANRGNGVAQYNASAAETMRTRAQTKDSSNETRIVSAKNQTDNKISDSESETKVPIRLRSARNGQNFTRASKSEVIATNQGSKYNDDAAAEVQASRSPSRKSRIRREAAPAKGGIAVCVKAVFGKPDAARLVEWIEFNRELGVDKIVFYDVASIGHGHRALERYAARGNLVDVVNFHYALEMRSITKDDPLLARLVGGQTMVDEQAYLVALNDCFYRLRTRYRYVMIIDWDEIIIPIRARESLADMADRAAKEFPLAVALMLPTAWHFHQFAETDAGIAGIAGNTSSAPPFLHMQRHLIRTPVMKASQPKPLVLPAHALAVNWHSVTRVPTVQPGAPSRGNQRIPWQQYGFVHHYRADCKHLPVQCDLLMTMGQTDEIVSRYRARLEGRVGTVLKELKLL